MRILLDENMPPQSDVRMRPRKLSESGAAMIKLVRNKRV